MFNTHFRPGRAEWVSNDRTTACIYRYESLGHTALANRYWQFRPAFASNSTNNSAPSVSNLTLYGFWPCNMGTPCVRQGLLTFHRITIICPERSPEETIERYELQNQCLIARRIQWCPTPLTQSGSCGMTANRTRSRAGVTAITTRLMTYWNASMQTSAARMNESSIQLWTMLRQSPEQIRFDVWIVLTEVTFKQKSDWSWRWRGESMIVSRLHSIHFTFNILIADRFVRMLKRPRLVKQG